MKKLIAATLAVSVLSGLAVTSANAAPLGRHHGLSPSERAAIARSEHQLNVLKRRINADGRVTMWERAQLRLAQSRHDALVWRYRHN